jgi:hypothetical protein
VTPRLSVKASIRSGWLFPITALLGLALVLPSSASADLTVGPSSPGAGAGQYQAPTSVAVDESNGLLYVADAGNDRVDVFDPSGTFLRAFGWGVADGTSAEPQTCTTTCFAGLPGGGAGQLGGASGTMNIAVDNDPASPSHHDVYVFSQARVQKFSPSGEFIAAYGGGVITAGAKGTGELNTGSVIVENVVLTQKVFARGQTITGAGIPANTKIVALGSDSITLSKPATASGTGVALAVAEGPGHVPVNEKILATFTGGPGKEFFIRFYPLPLSGFTTEQTKYLPAGVSAAVMEDALEGLASINPGDVSVTGADGGPYTIEFKGPRYGDTDIAELDLGGDSGGSSIVIQNGASAAATCTAAIASACSGGVAGAGEGQFTYVTVPLAVGPGGALYVADQDRVQKWSAAGAYEGQIALSGVPTTASGLAVEPSGDFYVLTPSIVQKFDPSGNLLATIPAGDGGNSYALALDPAGNLFVGRGGIGEITEYNPSGELVKVFLGEVGTGVLSLVPYQTASGDIFTVREEVFEGGASFLLNRGVVHVPIPPPGPLVYRGKRAPSALNVSAITSTKATFGASINPEGKETTYHVEYVDQAHFEAGGFSNPATKSGPSVTLPADFKFHLVSQPVTGLAPQTTYHFRVVASNADGTDPGPEASFKTLRSFEVEGLWATEVGSDAASLHAEVNPLGVPATAYFEYVDDATYQASGFAGATTVPDVGGGKAPLNLGGGESGVKIEAGLGSLVPATAYHYRLVAENSFGSEASDEHTLITFPALAQPKTDCPNQQFRTGVSAKLTDCRAYEMVSPVNKNGGDVAAGPIHEYGTLGKGATDGERVTFSSLRAFGDPQAAPLIDQYLSVRSTEGWATRSISPPRVGLPFFRPVGETTQSKAFSEDLCSTWTLQDSDVALTPDSPPHVPNLYRRDNCGAEDFYELLSTVVPPGFGVGKIEAQYAVPIPQGFSADESHSVFRIAAALTPNACKTPGIFQVYVTTKEGPPRLVSALPPEKGGKAPCTQTMVGVSEGQLDGIRGSSLSHAVSADGSRVFWTDSGKSSPFGSGSGSGQGAGKLYVRVNATEAPSKIAEGKCTQPEEACTQAISESANTLYWGASRNGDTAIHTVGTELFEYDVEEAKSQLIAKGVSGVIGESEDASRVYFISGEALSGEQKNSAGAKAQAGRPNIYLAEGGTLTYLATLGSREGTGTDNQKKPSSPGALQPYLRTSRVSPDGLHLAFTSAEPLSGYDSTDAVSGKPDTEVFLYDATPGAGAGQLACVSCNPSGARPRGRLAATLVDGNERDRWAAALLPGWSEQLSPTRLLSADGNRLYFNAFDALLPATPTARWTSMSGSAPRAPRSAGKPAPSSSSKRPAAASA